MIEIISKTFNRKQTTQNYSKYKKKYKRFKKIFDRIRTKTSYQRSSQNRRDTTGPNGKLQIMGLKCCLKGRIVCLTWQIFSPEIKQKSNFFFISGSSLHFYNRCSKFFSKKRIHNSFQIRGKKTQRQQDPLKTMLNLSIFVPNRSCCLIHKHFLKKQNTLR